MHSRRGRPRSPKPALRGRRDHPDARPCGNGHATAGGARPGPPRNPLCHREVGGAARRARGVWRVRKRATAAHGSDATFVTADANLTAVGGAGSAPARDARRARPGKTGRGARPRRRRRRGHAVCSEEGRANDLEATRSSIGTRRFERHDASTTRTPDLGSAGIDAVPGFRARHAGGRSTSACAPN